MRSCYQKKHHFLCVIFMIDILSILVKCWLLLSQFKWIFSLFFDKILPFQHRLSAAILWLIIFFGIPKIFQKSCQKKFYKSNFFRGLHAFNRGKKYDKNEKNKMFHTIFIFVDRNREIFYIEGSREREKLAFPEKVVPFLLRITNDFCLVVPPIDLTMTLWKFSPFLHCNPLKSQRKKNKTTYHFHFDQVYDHRKVQWILSLLLPAVHTIVLLMFCQIRTQGIDHHSQNYMGLRPKDSLSSVCCLKI